MKAMDFRGRTVVVTGASSGLGKEMATQLARDYGANLILVARRQELLDELAQQLASAHGVKVETIASDLGEEGAPARLFEDATSRGSIYAVVLNAGVTHFGHHDELSAERLNQMIDLNVRSTAQMIHQFVPYLEAQGQNGGVLLIASLAGLTPVAYQSAYSGTKAFLVNYGCSLHHEMKPRGVTVSTFAPGGIQTEMTQGARFNDLRAWLVPVGPCAKSAIEGLRRRRYLTIPGFIYRWGSLLTSYLPESLLVGQVAAQYKRSLDKNG